MSEVQPELFSVSVKVSLSSAAVVLPSAAGIFTCGTAAKPKVASHLFSTLTQIPINVFFHHAVESIIGLLLLRVLEQTSASARMKTDEGKGLILFLDSLLMCLFLLTAWWRLRGLAQPHRRGIQMIVGLTATAMAFRLCVCVCACVHTTYVGIQMCTHQHRNKTRCLLCMRWSWWVMKEGKWF